MRIVSLLPGATETLACLGLQEALVGISADTTWPPEVLDRPVLNTVALDPRPLSSREIDAAASADGHRGASLYHVDPERLRAVRPDLILTQEVCDVCAVSRRDVDRAAKALGYAPTVLSLAPATLDDVLADIGRIATAAGVGERGAAVVAELRRRLDAVRARTAGLEGPRVVSLEWLDPLYCAGHWVPEMVEIAGGEDQLGVHGGPSRVITWEAVRAAAPDVLVLMPCSLPPERVAAEFGLVRDRPGWWELPAVRSGRVYAGHTRLFSQSGPRLVEGVEVLARLLHPERFPEPLPEDYALRVSADGRRLEPFF
jgi:iron complex transport system substrate-binding protein